MEITFAIESDIEAILALQMQIYRTNSQASNAADVLKKQILEGKLNIGMPDDMVLAIIGYRPKDINRTVTSQIVHEQWVYTFSMVPYRYLYFENNKLTVWQD